MKKIEIEKAKNQKTEEVPLFETYYLAFVRNKGCEWFQAGICTMNKQNIINDIRTYWTNYDEHKIISVELPF